MPDHKPHQTTSNFCIPPSTKSIIVASKWYGDWHIYRSVEAALKNAKAPVYKVTLTWEEVEV